MSQIPPEELLQRVLTLEQRQGFENRAMLGGLSAFARDLHERSGAGSRVPEAALLLAHYDQDAINARKSAVEAAIAVLDGSNNRVHEVDLKPARKPPVSGNDHRPIPATPAAPATPRRPEYSGILSTSVQSLSGVGPKRAEQLASVGLTTVGDVLYHFPREHLDYRRRDRIRTLPYAEPTTIIASIAAVRVRRIRKKLSITTVTLADDSGRIAVDWFNQPYPEKTFRIGRQIAVSGHIDFFRERRVFKPRDYEWVDEEELTHAGRLVPIYPLHKGLYQKSVRSLVRSALDTFGERLTDPLPAYITEQFNLLDLRTALSDFHFPETEEDASEGRRRLAFDEVLAIQLGLRLRKEERESGGNAPAMPVDERQKQVFLDAIPFEPTQAQRRVMAEIERALSSKRPMSRLIQGDVGSGKTAVAALGLFMAAQNGFQSLMMAPTEILAHQHFKSLSQWLEPIGVGVGLVTGSTPAGKRKSLLQYAETGHVQVLVGTHAIFEDAIALSHVGLVVVDEQHRFGVEQRSRLRQKGTSPHLLAMTATPIPRTLQLTLYGDLDISVIDELPPGRMSISTKLFNNPTAAYDKVRTEVEAGRQAFVVCPVIDESLDEDMKSAIAEHRRLEHEVFPGLKVALLHGRMKSKEKEAVLLAFREGTYQVLVATSVVEVGLDVPNATVMVIQDAHRFGLAQLHQLRGRVGRGSDQSYCLLVSPIPDGPTIERLNAVVASNDGFKLAEKDLELRGPGEFWGTRQSGLPDLRLAGPGDTSVIETAGAAVSVILERDPTLTRPEHTGLREQVDRFWSAAAELH